MICSFGRGNLGVRLRGRGLGLRSGVPPFSRPSWPAGARGLPRNYGHFMGGDVPAHEVQL